eukprot:Filipodium_phascolosomae@DN969_c0_g1_i3.p1
MLSDDTIMSRVPSEFLGQSSLLLQFPLLSLMRLVLRLLSAPPVVFGYLPVLVGSPPLSFPPCAANTACSRSSLQQLHTNVTRALKGVVIELVDVLAPPQSPLRRETGGTFRRMFGLVFECKVAACRSWNTTCVAPSCSSTMPGSPWPHPAEGPARVPTLVTFSSIG